MYVYRSSRSIDRENERERRRKRDTEKKRETEWSHGESGPRINPSLSRTANISLRLDVSPYNARRFLSIADRSFNYATSCRSHSRRLIMTNRYRTVPFHGTEWGLFLKREYASVSLAHGTVRQCFRFPVMQRDTTKLTATLITRTIHRSPFHSRLWHAQVATRALLPTRRATSLI